jgi:hypothetical protein
MYSFLLNKNATTFLKKGALSFFVYFYCSYNYKKIKALKVHKIYLFYLYFLFFTITIV